MAPKKQQSKSEGGGKKKEHHNKGGNKATTAPNGDDECADMPPLEDMRKSDTTGNVKAEGGEGGKVAKEGKEEVKLREVRWQSGQAPLGMAFSNTDIREAHRKLKVDPGTNDEELLPVLNEMTTELVTGGATHENVAEKIGALLLIACSRTIKINSPYFALVQKVYTYEANYHLLKVKLPVPKNLPTYETPALLAVVYEGASSPEALKVVQRTHSLTDTERARIATSEKEAKESKGELEKMKIELVDYKAEVKEGFKARDEKASELEKVVDEKEDVKRELEKEKGENAKLKEELAKLRASSSSSSSQVASSDKTSFVIKNLSRQVKDLGRQVKDKNDQLAEMMVEMSKVGFE